MRYLLTLTATLAALFALQSHALHLSGGRTAKSESNFFSSLARIQAGARGEAKVMLLGSSITGRLPDRAQGFDGWANMGCDGGSAVDALRAMDKGILPTSPLLVIEANTLHMPLVYPLTEVETAMNQPWFKVGLRIPALSAYARPSAFFYSALLERRIGGFTDEEASDLGVASTPEMVALPPDVTLSSTQEKLITEMRGILQRLREKGSRAVIVWLPPARPDGNARLDWILEMARQCDVPFWDLGQEVEPGTVTLTDGIHMDSPSAACVMRSMRKAFGLEQVRREQGDAR